MSLKHFILYISTLAGGLGLGWMMTDNPQKAPSVRGKLHAAERSQSPRRMNVAELLQMIRAKSAENKSQQLLKDRVASWSDAEVLAALDQCLKDPNLAVSSPPGETMDQLLLTELIQRDYSKAVKWIEGIHSSVIQSRYVLILNHYWPPEKIEEGIAFMMKYPQLLSDGSGWSIVIKAFNNRAKQGPAAVNDLLEKILQHKIPLPGASPLSSGQNFHFYFPENFDYKAIAASSSFQKLFNKNQTDLYFHLKSAE